MSSGKTKNVSAVCLNPYCNSRRKSFATELAFTMHVERSPACLQWMQQQGASITSSAGPHTLAGKRPFDDVLNDSIVLSSTVKSTLLRRDMVNADAPIVDQNDTYSALPVSSWMDLADVPNDWDDNSNHSGTAAADAVWNTALSMDNAQQHHAPPLNTSTALGLVSTPFMYTTDQKWTMALLKVLDDLNAPDYAFEALIKWGRAAHTNGYSFLPPGGQTRSRNLDALFKSVHNGHRLLPSVITVNVPHGPAVDVIAYDFAPQLLSLLQNPSIMTADNLLINLKDPLCPYHSPDGRLGDAISGTVYHAAYRRLITKPNRQLFVPIIQWIDRTSVTGNDRFSLKPYMFTPAIFTEKFRRTLPAWGYHGFLPKSSASSAQNQVQPQGNNIRNYHAQLNAVLRSFVAPGPALCNVTLPIGPTGHMCVDIVACILFVIQDMQEGDSLCGRFGPHTPQIKRHCRSCTVEYEHLKRTVKRCQYIDAAEMAVIAQSLDDSLRQQWSQHFLNNAFDHVPMADPKRGIFGATPVETLHAYRKGLIEMVTFLVLENVPASKKAALDALAIRFHKTHRQTIRRTFPATDFSSGITNKTKLSASERLGLVFLFIILAQYDEGSDILYKALNQRSKADMKEVLQVLEAMVCFDAWLNQDKYWKLANMQNGKLAAITSISKLLSLCQKHIPLVNGKTWNFPKFHELLHLVDDMERFGAPVNYCAQRPESLLIPVAKQPGRRAQKRHEGAQYELQAAQRLSYSIMIDTMTTRICDTDMLAGDSMQLPSTDKINETTDGATFGTVSSPDGIAIHVCWNTTTNLALMQLPVALLQFLISTFGPHEVVICTQYVRDVFIFRCHPAFYSGSPIYDWMLIDFEIKKGKKTENTAFPCRLAAVVVCAVTESNPNPYQLVVQSATKKTGTSSVLLTEWYWSPNYIVISPDTIVSPCFVISIKDDDSVILETKQFHEWPLAFTSPVD